MRYLLESVSEGVVERFFTQGDTRGVLWLPAGPPMPAP